MSETKSNKPSNLIDHLTELRSRLLNSFIFFLVIFLVSYFFSEEIYRFLVKPYSDSIIENNLDRKLIFTALHEAFLTYLKVAFFSALFLTSPIFLTQIWKFIAPGLYQNEKNAFLPYLILTPILFLIGGVLVYCLIMPLAINFFWDLNIRVHPALYQFNWKQRLMNTYL